MKTQSITHRALTAVASAVERNVTTQAQLITGLLALLLLTPAPQALAANEARFEQALAAFNEASGTRDIKHEGFVRAFTIWSQLAKEGDTRANYHLGMMNMFGLGGAEFEQSVGVQNIRLAAEGGYPIAQSFMGFLVEKSDGSLVRTGDELAFNWWRKGAQGNHCAGVRRLVRVYEKGELGQSVDSVKSAEWQARLENCNKR